MESLWAVDQSDGTARFDKIPWFVRGIACGDIVATEPDEEGVRWAGEVVRRSRTAPSASSCAVAAALELCGRA
ncbi:DUF4265 domain-containing protein [Streptomyces murinus]|uniref:DUF4265 domain-containing protein n=1 Tax=Streptomyces murinus TaxID=33900 RepID=UPI00372D7106